MGKKVSAGAPSVLNLLMFSTYCMYCIATALHCIALHCFELLTAAACLQLDLLKPADTVVDLKMLLCQGPRVSYLSARLFISRRIFNRLTDELMVGLYASHNRSNLWLRLSDDTLPANGQAVLCRPNSDSRQTFSIDPIG